MLRLQTLFALLACCFLASRAVSIPTNNAEDVSAGRNDHNLASLQETITTHMNALALAHNITSSTLVSTFFDRNDSILYTERVYHPYLDHLDLQRGSFERDFYLSFIYLLRWMPLKDAHSVSPDFIARNIELALKARQLNTLTQAVPFSVFLNEVLPYAILTEHRDDWRDLFFSSFFPLVQHASSLREAAAIMNKQSWHIVEPAIKFVAAPPNELNNYSPFSVMKAHNASCTGLSIFLVDALRSVGIPARLTGVLHWNQDKSVCPDGDASPDCGNHNWVEAYLDGEWCFLDEAGDGRVNHGWFYPGNSDHQVPNTRNHSIYSSSYAPAKLLDASLYPSTSFPIDHYPLAWDIHYEGVHGWDNTVQYINHTFSS